MAARPLLTARWEHLVLLNYEVDPALLEPLVPRGTELDSWQGQYLASLVGFRFTDTRIMGLAIPWHRDFDEVNLRFYVRRRAADGIRRAVVFVRELVPRRAIAAVARVLYNEPYLAVPMSSSISLDSATGGTARYTWRYAGSEYAVSARAVGSARPLEPGSAAEFITEHYWGYTRQRDGSTLEYQVEHPPWSVWTATEPRFDGPARVLYGELGSALAGQPISAHIAVGSPVAVHRGAAL